jgi:hypothetical protein
MLFIDDAMHTMQTLMMFLIIHFMIPRGLCQPVHRIFMETGLWATTEAVPDK